MLPIQFMQILHNISKRGVQPQYIVIHDTANASVGANAYRHFQYFNGAERNASADFFIDDSNIIQVNDYTRYYTYHCNDKTLEPGPYRKLVHNNNSIGLELCINKDGNYNNAFNNLVDITLYLMNKLSISDDRVIRHKDVSGKNCPTTMNMDNEKLWKEFKSRISNGGKLTMEQYNQIMTYIHNLENELTSTKAKLETVLRSQQNDRIDIDKVSSYAGIKYGYLDDNMPSWAFETIHKLKDRGALSGDTAGNLNLSESDIRTFVILDRLHIIDDSIRYDYLKDIPEWGVSSVEKLIKSGALKSSDGELNLTYDMIRMIVYLDRINAIK